MYKRWILHSIHNHSLSEVSPRFWDIEVDVDIFQLYNKIKFSFEFFQTIQSFLKANQKILGG